MSSARKLYMKIQDIKVGDKFIADNKLFTRLAESRVGIGPGGMSMIYVVEKDGKLFYVPHDYDVQPVNM